jgi:hypothetical protein
MSKPVVRNRKHIAEYTTYLLSVLYVDMREKSTKILEILQTHVIANSESSSANLITFLFLHKYNIGSPNRYLRLV